MANDRPWPSKRTTQADIFFYETKKMKTSPSK